MTTEGVQRAELEAREEQRATDELDRELSQEKTTVGKAVVLGIVGMEIGPGLAAIGGYAFLLSGSAGWLSMLIVGLLCSTVLVTVRVFTRKYSPVGGAMTYILKSGQVRLGQLVGVSQVLCYVVICASGPVAAAVHVASFLRDLGFEDAQSSWFQVAVFVTVGLVSIVPAIMGLETLYWISLIGGIVAIPLIVWITAQALITQGDAVDWSQSFSWDWSGSQFALALVGVPILLSFFTGFDDNSMLAVNTDNPKKNAFRITSITFVVLFLLYFGAVLVQAPLVTNFSEDVLDGGSPMASIADNSGLGYLSPFIDLVLALALLSLPAGQIYSGGRTVAAASAAGLLPAAMRTVGARFHTPHRGMILMGAIAISVPSLAALTLNTTPVEAGIMFGEFLTYIYMVPYVVAGAAAIILLRRERRGLASAIFIGLGVAGFGIFTIWSMSQGADDFYDLIPWISVGAVLVYFVIVLIVQRTRPIDTDALLEMDVID